MDANYIPYKMHAMLFEKAHKPLKYKQVPLPKYGKDQVLVKVKACGVCRTDLHVVDGDLPNRKTP